MRSAKILFKNEEAGILTQRDDGTFSFRYLENWLTDHSKHGISLTLPKGEREFQSKFLFPFFSICYQRVLTNNWYVPPIE